MFHCYNTLKFGNHFGIPGVLRTGTSVGCLWQWAGWPTLFCGSTQDLHWQALAQNRSEEKCGHIKLNRSGRWTERRKKKLAVRKACMAIFWPTPDFTGTSLDSWFWTETLTFACAVTSCTVVMETSYWNPGLQVMAQSNLALTSKKHQKTPHNAFYHCFDWKTWSERWPNSLI